LPKYEIHQKDRGSIAIDTSPEKERFLFTQNQCSFNLYSTKLYREDNVRLSTLAVETRVSQKLIDLTIYSQNRKNFIFPTT